MGYLYVDVWNGDNSIIVLNRKYTKAEIREKLLVPDGGYTEKYVEELLAKAVYLKEPLTLKCKEDEGVITTQIHGKTWYIHWGETVTITPDADFDRNERSKIDQLLLNVRNIWEYILYYL